MKIYPIQLIILLILSIHIITCSSKDKMIESKKPPDDKKIEKEVVIEKKPENEPPKIIPQFIPINIIYDPKKRLSVNELYSMTEMELSLLRVQIFNRNGYDFEKKWKELYYREKLGSRELYDMKYDEMDMKPIDKLNDQSIVDAILQKKNSNKVYYDLPSDTGFYIKEIYQDPINQKYFLAMTDENHIQLKKDDIPFGFVKPQFTNEVSKETWHGLVVEENTFKDMKFKTNPSRLYLVKYFPNEVIRYVIVFEIVGNRITFEDAKNFIFYNLEGKLLRNIYHVGNQETYERDYIYDKSGLVKIVEKVMQENQLKSAMVLKKNPDYVMPENQNQKSN